jgi:rod shape-determining protein MreB
LDRKQKKCSDGPLKNIKAIRPLKDGVIADFKITEELLRYAIKASLNKRFARPKTIICIPSGITEVEKKAVRDSAMSSGASQVYLVDEAIAAALGVGLPIEEPSGNIIIDIGGGTTEVTVISFSGIVYVNLCGLEATKWIMRLSNILNENIIY